jgi:hypothetical protein
MGAIEGKQIAKEPKVTAEVPMWKTVMEYNGLRESVQDLATVVPGGLAEGRLRPIICADGIDFRAGPGLHFKYVAAPNAGTNGRIYHAMDSTRF